MKHTENLHTPFDAYEIHGVREFETGPDRYCEQVSDSDAEFWSLYGHIPGQGVECIGDYKSRQAAEEMYARITGRSFCNRQPPDRVARFAKVVGEYGDDDARTNLVDLLADGMHWCPTKAVSFDESLQSAAKHFDAETTEGGQP